MKKAIIFILIVALILLAVPSVMFAAKPTTNLAGAQKVAWNLSGDVMPSPPWGLSDIPGSDTASKLIVNQPNGNTEVAITGAMNGLDPNTEYTVYLSNAWSTSEKWNITGDWELRFVLGGNYDHDMTVTFQNMQTGVFSGTGHNSSTWDILGTSKVVGDTIYLDLKYTGSSYTVNAVGTINAADGAIINGTWSSNIGQSGTWSSITGAAIKKTVGNGYPGLFYTQKTFTFTTDEYGAGSWHLNLRDEDFPKSGTYNLSVWINKGGTILISDNFQVVAE